LKIFKGKKLSVCCLDFQAWRVQLSTDHDETLENYRTRRCGTPLTIVSASISGCFGFREMEAAPHFPVYCSSPSKTERRRLWDFQGSQTRASQPFTYSSFDSREGAATIRQDTIISKRLILEMENVDEMSRRIEWFQTAPLPGFDRDCLSYLFVVELTASISTSILHILQMRKSSKTRGF